MVLRLFRLSQVDRSPPRLDVDILNRFQLQSRINSNMSRQFFVGGNFKMNPCTREQKAALIQVLNNAELDPSTGNGYT